MEDKPKQASRVLDFAKNVITGLIGFVGGTLKDEPWYAMAAVAMIIVFAGYTIRTHKRCTMKRKQPDA